MVTGRPAAAALPVVRIEKGTGRRGLGLLEAWQSRELLWFLAQRDVKVRYKQTIFGVGWAIVQPVAMMIVFTLVFGRLAGLSSDGVPYRLFVLAGLVAWGFVSASVPAMAGSLVGNPLLITRVPIRKMAIPTSAMLAYLVDLAVATALLVGYAAILEVTPTVRLIALPLFVLLMVATVLGLGLLLAAINVLFRDVRYVVPFLVQLWLFATPVVYSLRAVDGSVRWLYGLNPMVAVVEGFRWAVLDEGSGILDVLPSGIAMAVILLVVGSLVFRRLEPIFADVI